MRQKVVSVLIFLGVVFSIFRCSAGDKDESTQEVALSTESETETVHQEQVAVGHSDTEASEKADMEHTDKVVEHAVEVPDVTTHVENRVKPTHDKTLFFKSDSFIQDEKIEMERMATLAVATQAQDKEHAKAREAQARLEREKAAKIKADKEAQERAALQAQADKKLSAERERVNTLQEKVTLEAENSKMKSSQEALLSKIGEWEVKAAAKEESLKIKAAAEEKLLAKIGEWEVKVAAAEEESKKIKVSAKEKLLAKIKEWEVKVSESEAESKKLKVAAVAAAALATQQAVANATSDGEANVGKIKSDFQAKIDEWEKKALDAQEKAAEEKKALEVANAKMTFSQESLLEKIGELEVKATASKAADEDEIGKLQSALEKMTEEKTALQGEVEASAQVNVDMNSSINTTKAALLTKIEEWEKKALKAESQEHTNYTATVEKYKTVLANLTQEKVALEDENTKMKSSQEALLEKIGVWEVRVSDTEAESKKLKVAAVAAAALATQQAVANATSEGDANTDKIKSDFQAKIDEWEKKALDAESKAANEKKTLEDENANMLASKEALLVKITEWENKVSEAEAESKKLKIAAAAAAALATQQAVANATSEGDANTDKIKSDFQAKIDEWEKKALQAEENAASEKKILEEEKEETLASNLVKIAEWEKKALDAESKAASEKKTLEDENANMLASKEALLVKITEWENKVSDAEAESKKLKIAAAAAAALATQQAVANATSEGDANTDKIKSDFQAKIDEWEKKALDAESKAASEKKALEDENANMLASKEALLVKIAEWEKKAKAVEEEVNDKRAVAAQALVDAQDKLSKTLALTKIEFKYGSAMLTGNSEELLNSVSQIMHEHPELTYDIQGHTDAHGNEDYNVKLSTSRAQKVKEYLINKGVSSTSLNAKGFGSAMPIADNATNEGRLQNRRVVIKIVE